VAFALAPLACPLVFCLLGILIPDAESQPQGPVANPGVWVYFLNTCGWLPILSLYALPIAYLTELLLGLPAWMVFRHYGVRSFGAYAAGGAVIGWFEVMALTTISGVPMATAFSLERLRFDFDHMAAASVCAVVFRAILSSGAARKSNKPQTLATPADTD
jgi:hypothetical protein